MTTLYANGTRRQLPRPQVSDAVDGLAIVHWPRTTFDDGSLEAVSIVQRAGAPIYKVSGLRQPWQPVIVPDHLDTHELVVAWLVAGLAGDGDVRIAA